MKKIFLYACTLACTTTLFVACSSNDNNGTPEEGSGITAPAVVGTYRGNLDITMTPDGSNQETVIAENFTKNISISQVSDTEVKMELKDFDLLVNGTLFKLGNITIDKCVVTQDGTSYSFTGVQSITFEGAAAALGTCNASVDGEVEGNNMDMDILVKVPSLQQTVKVDFEGVKLVTDTGTYYDFETWNKAGDGPTSELVYYNPEGWSSSNTGVQYLIQAGYADKYVVTQTADAHWGKSAARIETIDTKGADLGTTIIPKVTTGSLFFGTFSIDLTHTLKSTKFGIPYAKKPLYLKGYYKYTPGTTYYVCQSPTTANVATVDPTKTDQFSINAVLYTTPNYAADDSDCLTGVDIYNSNRIVATASLKGGTQSDWTFFDITLNYIQVYNPALKYRFAIICSSSSDGNNFNGAPGSALIVDDFELISAE